MRYLLILLSTLVYAGGSNFHILLTCDEDHLGIGVGADFVATTDSGYQWGIGLERLGPYLPTRAPQIVDHHSDLLLMSAELGYTPTPNTSLRVGWGYSSGIVDQYVISGVITSLIGEYHLSPLTGIGIRYFHGEMEGSFIDTPIPLTQWGLYWMARF